MTKVVGAVLGLLMMVLGKNLYKPLLFYLPAMLVGASSSWRMTALPAFGACANPGHMRRLGARRFNLGGKSWRMWASPWP